jgi:hypothetical protein
MLTFLHSHPTVPKSPLLSPHAPWPRPPHALGMQFSSHLVRVRVRVRVKVKVRVKVRIKVRVKVRVRVRFGLVLEQFRTMRSTL